MLPGVGCIVGDVLSDRFSKVEGHEFAYSGAVEDLSVSRVAEFGSPGAHPFHDSVCVVEVSVFRAILKDVGGGNLLDHTVYRHGV